jgi:hypothetical protein
MERACNLGAGYVLADDNDDHNNATDNGTVDNHAHARRDNAECESLYAGARHDVEWNASARQRQSLSAAVSDDAHDASGPASGDDA